MKKTFRAIVIDDERLARQELKRLLQNFPQVKVVAEASNISEAVKEINHHEPDLLFLDIQLRNENGFDLLEKIAFLGDVIFVTAFDKYAVRAFEINALDYLLKPVNEDRLEKSLDKLSQKQPGSKTPLSQPDDLIFLKFSKSMRFVKLNTILKVLADGSYSKLYLTDGSCCMMSKPLKYWQDKLPGQLFMRVHRSTIINLDHIQAMSNCQNYSYKIIMNHGGEEIIASRRYSIKLRERFK